MTGTLDNCKLDTNDGVDDDDKNDIGLGAMMMMTTMTTLP